MNPILIDLNTFHDSRGTFFESYKESILHEFNIKFSFVQENTCISNKNVIRGFHYQNDPHSQAKLLSVLNGKIKDIVIDIRQGTSFGKIWEFDLDSNNKQLLYIPKGFAHGYASYNDNTIVSYKTDALYNKDSEDGFNPLSNSLDLNWGIINPILSVKDLQLKQFNLLQNTL